MLQHTQQIGLQDYLDDVPSAMQQDLHELISLMTVIAPEAELNCELGIPYFQQNNQIVYGIAARQDHFIMYFNNTDLLLSFAARLDHVHIGNGCLSFHCLADINVNILTELLAQVKVHAAQKIRIEKAQLH